MDEYEVYEKECKEIREINEELLELFEKDMMDKNLADKTINRHLSNVNFYINEYMLHEDATPMEDGVRMLDMFLGDFFIRKCMWSTPASIKSTAASIKKFYKCMLDYGKIEKADYEFLCADIKEGMDEWRSACEAYNDPDQESPFYDVLLVKESEFGGWQISNGDFNKLKPSAPSADKPAHSLFQVCVSI